MKVLGIVVIGLLLSISLTAQISLRKLVIKSKESYELINSDILVVDTLIMEDQSKLILNKLKPDNFIHAKVIILNKSCTIDGRGVQGLKGRTGKKGSSPLSPCTDGTNGLAGSEGTYGGSGTNLSLYFSEFILKGTLTIDVSGGDGGNGGTGGEGGGGGPGTRICAGGNGGIGGNGSLGGNGGNAGVVNFIAPRIPEVRNLLGDKIIIQNYGGSAGNGGDGGARGEAGLSPVGNTKLDGKVGKKGTKGADGIAGKPGAVNFKDK